MKTLAYTTAFGKPVYMELARLAVSSLLRQGFAGDVVILTDREGDEVQGAKVIPLPENKEGAMWKSRLPEAVPNVEEYDVVMFFDTDILFVGPVHELVGLGTDRIHVAGEDYPLAKNNFNSTFLSERTTPPEWGGNMLNSGLVTMPGRLAAEFLRAWNDAWTGNYDRIPRWWKGDTKAHARKQLFDQPSLQLLVSTGVVEAGMIPLHLIHYPALQWYWKFGKRIQPGCVAIHLNGPLCDDTNKARLLGWMRELYDADDIEALTDRISGEMVAEDRARNGADDAQAEAAGKPKRERSVWTNLLYKNRNGARRAEGMSA